MKCNVGKNDRMIRVILGILIIVYGISEETWLGVVGLFPLLTGIFQWCPTYELLGKSTIDDEDNMSV